MRTFKYLSNISGHYSRMSNIRSRTRIEIAQKANRDRGEKTKDKVFSLIGQSEPRGMTTADLVKASGRNRKSIHAICQEYILKGELAKTGKFGTYHLGPKSAGEPRTNGFLFHSKALKQFFAFEYLPAYDRIWNKERRKQHFLKREDKSFLDDPAFDELWLFEYSIRVGTMITYVMMKAMKYHGDENVWKYIQNAINLQSLLRIFTEIGPVFRRLKCNKVDVKEGQEYNGPSYEMDSDDLSTLEKAFENVFPDTYRKLENITSDIPRKLESKRDQLKTISKIRRSERRDPNHSKCDGQQVSEVETDLVIEGKKAKLIRLKKCLKCGRLFNVNEVAKESN